MNDKKAIDVIDFASLIGFLENGEIYALLETCLNSRIMVGARGDIYGLKICLYFSTILSTKSTSTIYMVPKRDASTSHTTNVGEAQKDGFRMAY